jgi:hypothetical protein
VPPVEGWTIARPHGARATATVPTCGAQSATKTAALCVAGGIHVPRTGFAAMTGAFRTRFRRRRTGAALQPLPPDVAGRDVLGLVVIMVLENPPRSKTTFLGAHDCFSRRLRLTPTQLSVCRPGVSTARAVRGNLSERRVVPNSYGYLPNRQRQKCVMLLLRGNRERSIDLRALLATTTGGGLVGRLRSHRAAFELRAQYRNAYYCSARRFQF